METLPSLRVRGGSHGFTALRREDVRQERRSDNLSKYAIPRDQLWLQEEPFAHGGSGEVYRGRYCNEEVDPPPETLNFGPSARNPKRSILRPRP